jgi:hypothetical protein
VSDSFSVALSATVAMLELAGAAVAMPAAIKTATATAVKKAKLCKCAFMFISLPGNGDTKDSPGSSNPGTKVQIWDARLVFSVAEESVEITNVISNP